MNEQEFNGLVSYIRSYANAVIERIDGLKPTPYNALNGHDAEWLTRTLHQAHGNAVRVRKELDYGM